MKLTTGMAVYNDFHGVYQTVQALRVYHGHVDMEVLVVDNFGDPLLETWCNNWIPGKVTYKKYTDIQGTTAPRQKVFEYAQGEYVVCIDSHVFIWPGGLDRLWDGPHLIHGPMVWDNLEACVCQMDDEWRDNMWGVWGDSVRFKSLPKEPFEIPMHGLGLFGCRKADWLGFNDQFRGFGGEEGYIHEKFKQAGRKVLCLPWLKWVHRFSELTGVRYKLDNRDRVRNYIIGHKELGLSLEPIRQHFSPQIVNSLMK